MRFFGFFSNFSKNPAYIRVINQKNRINMIRTIDKPSDFQTKVVMENIEIVERYNTILYDIDGVGVYLVMEKTKTEKMYVVGTFRILHPASKELKRGDERVIEECKNHMNRIFTPRPRPSYELRPEVYVSSNLSGVDYMKSKVKPLRPKRYKNLIVN